MSIHHFTQAITDKERAERCFNGEILIYRNIPAMHELIAYADDLLSTAFGGVEPIEAQHHFWPEEFLQRSGKAQADFRNSAAPKDLFFKALEQCGVDLENTFYDHFPMRIVPFGKDYNGARNSHIGHHRDSWGSNIHSQINWWAPIYELEEERTIAFYPEYWDKPIKNNTGTWLFEDFMKQRKSLEAERDKKGAERKGSYPSAPSPVEQVDESGVLKVILEPGDILNFSSAHLHGSVPNTTDTPRYSVEMRTINKHDLDTNRAAPNVDNAGEKQMYEWFKSISNKKSLSIYAAKK